MTVTEFLQRFVPFLAGITEEQAHALAAKAEQKSFKKGQTVLFKGVSVEGLHVVAQGKVSVLVKSDKSKDWVKVAELGPGEVFGETSIVEFAMAGATIKCEMDGSLVFIIPQELFTDLMATDPGFKARVQAVIDARRPKPKGAEAKPAEPKPGEGAPPKPAA